MFTEANSRCGDVSELDHGYVVSPPPPCHHGDTEFGCTEPFTVIAHRSVTSVMVNCTPRPQRTGANTLPKLTFNKT